MTPTSQIAFVNMIEFSLASYEHECSLKRPRRGELDRLETMLRSTLEACSAELPAVVRMVGASRAPARLQEILNYMEENQEPARDAFSRFVLKTRYPYS